MGGQLLKARVLYSSANKKQLELSLLPEISSGKTLAKLDKVDDVKGGGMVARFTLPGRRMALAHITELYDHWAMHPLRRLKGDKYMEVAIISAPKKSDDPSAPDRVEVSLRASQVQGRPEASDEKRPMVASEIKKGDKVNGYVVNSGDKGVFVALSRKLSGRIRLKALGDEMVLKDRVAQLHPPGELIREAKVIDIDDQGRVELSLRKGGGSGSLTVEQLTVGDVVSGRVKNVEKYGFFMRLNDSQVDGLVHATDLTDYSASVTVQSFKAGDVIKRAKILKIENGKLWLGVKPSLFEGMPVEDEDDDEEGDDAMDEEVQAMDEDDDEEAAKKAKAANKKAKKAKAAEEVEASEDKDEEVIE